MSRWIRLDAGIFEHGHFQVGTFSEREAWLWLLVKAAWKDTRHRIGSSVVDVPVGSMFVTLRQLQSAWNWGSDYRVRTFLKALETERMISLETNAGKTHVTICNYSKYQTDFTEENAQKTQAQRTENAQKTPIHQYTIEDTPNVVSSKRGTRLSPEWAPSPENITYATSQGLVGEVMAREVEKFRDYWTAKAGQSAVKLDWDATWRNWVRTSVSRGPPRGGGKPQKTAYQEHQEACARELDKIINRENGYDNGSSNIIDLGSTDYRRDGSPRSRW